MAGNKQVMTMQLKNQAGSKELRM